MFSKNRRGIGDSKLDRLRRGKNFTFTSKRELCASLVSLLLVFVLGLPIYTLRVKEATKGCELASIQVSEGDLLKVEYTHSMYKVKQSEVFSIGHDSRFYLQKVMFGSYAAALYYDIEPSQGLTSEDGLWMVKWNGKNYSILKYRVSPNTGHVLHVGNQRLDRSGNFQSQGGLMIEVGLEKEGGN